MASETSDTDTNSLNEYSEPGRFVKRMYSSSSEDPESDSSNSPLAELQEKYNNLLRKFQNKRRKKNLQRSNPINKNGRNEKSLAERIRGWQTMELERIPNNKEQYQKWLTFQSTVEANWELYGVQTDEEKLICLQTKCKGFIVEMLNSLRKDKSNFSDIWNGIAAQFFAPIDSGEEIFHFYQMKQRDGENIFEFVERVTKQAFLCNFEEKDCAKRIGNIFVRNCLNPGFFLSVFDELDDLDKLKHHARNFHAALPKPIIRTEPVLAVNHSYHLNNKRRPINFNETNNKKPRYDSKNWQNNNRSYYDACRYFGERTCNRRTCPARGKRCSYCQFYDHFEKVCRKKKFDLENIQKDTVNAIAKEEKEDEAKVNHNDEII